MSTTTMPIDVWDIETFDSDFLTQLREQADLVRQYMGVDRQIFLEHDLGRSRSTDGIRPTNPWASAFQQLKEEIGHAMARRTIRAWHYTRLTDTETLDMRKTGIHVSTPDSLRMRLDALVSAGELNTAVADAAYRESPFHSDQLQARQGKFWMNSHPISAEDSLVSRLLTYWGGEVSSFWTKDPETLDRLSKIGRPRVVEIAVPMFAAGESNAYCASAAVIATFGRSLGCVPGKQAFDLYSMHPLPSDAVLAIHTEGEPDFSRIGDGFPTRFVDADKGYWKELTGEDC